MERNDKGIAGLLVVGIAPPPWVRHQEKSKSVETRVSVYVFLRADCSSRKWRAVVKEEVGVFQQVCACFRGSTASTMWKQFLRMYLRVPGNAGRKNWQRDMDTAVHH